MKTYLDIYGDIITLSNLYKAYYEARKGKVDKTFREFDSNLHENIWKLHEELLNQTYEPSPYTVFYVNDYKERRIMAPHFRDHIVHHAIYNILEQIYDSTFIYDSYACRKGKGTHKGFNRLRSFIHNYSNDDYFLKCDITKYFYSIDHYTLMAIIERKIKDKHLLWLLKKILDSHYETPSPSHIINPNHIQQKKGIPIGNLTSQLFANIYLNELDLFVKHKLQIKHFIRFVDDFIILAKDINYLKTTWQKLHHFLKTQLYLKLEQRKTQLNKISFGVDFLGYVAFKNHVRVRSRNYRRFRIRLNQKISRCYLGEISKESLDASFICYLGHLSHTNSNKIMEIIKSLQIKVATTITVPCSGVGTGTMGRMPGPFVPI